MKVCRPLKSVLLSLWVLGSFGFSHQALAHKLNLFAFAEGDTVSVEGYFADGRKTQNSSVKVLDGSGKVLLEGVTDGEGKYKFKAPQKTDLKIVLNAGMGHQGEFMMSAAELSEGNVAAPTQAAVEGGGAEAMVAAPVANSELESTVHRAVSEAIKPLVRELAESRQHTSISELVGAVGYIFGLLGLFAYYKARQASGKTAPSQRPEEG